MNTQATFEALVNASVEITGIPSSEFLSQRRIQEFVRIRAAIMYIMRESGCKLTKIGEVFGKDHSSVLHVINTAKNYFDTPDQDTSKIFISLYNQLATKSLAVLKPRENSILMAKRNAFMGGSIYAGVGILAA